MSEPGRIPGVTCMRNNEGGWTGRPGNVLSQSTQDHWNALPPHPPQGYVVYLGEAMRREATRGEAESDPVRAKVLAWARGYAEQMQRLGIQATPSIPVDLAGVLTGCGVRCESPRLSDRARMYERVEPAKVTFYATLTDGSEVTVPIQNGVVNSVRP